MEYIEVKISPSEAHEIATALLPDLLSPLGFDSFMDNEDHTLLAYIPLADWQEEALRDVLTDFPLPEVTFTWEARQVPWQDWNSEWEEAQRFTPIVLQAAGGEAARCVVCTPATDRSPWAACPYQVLITPRMSFGTGQHATTRMMLQALLDLPLTAGIRCLDMGTGTGVLAILAALRGATVWAIEIDPHAADNARDNVRLNGVEQRVTVLTGDASAIGSIVETSASTDGRQTFFDLVLANINRNILLADMARYVQYLKPKGQLLLSGFLPDDVAPLTAAAASLGLQCVGQRQEEEWCLLQLEKA